jgi:hypothetical protein
MMLEDQTRQLGLGTDAGGREFADSQPLADAERSNNSGEAVPRRQSRDNSNDNAHQPGTMV